MDKRTDGRVDVDGLNDDDGDGRTDGPLMDKSIDCSLAFTVRRAAVTPSLPHNFISALTVSVD